MTDTRKFSIGERITVRTPGRFSKLVTGTVTGGDEHFISYRADGCGVDENTPPRKTRRGAIQPGNPE